MRKKIKKLITFSTIGVGFSGTAFLVTTSTVHNKQLINWYDFYASDKFEVRAQNSAKVININNEELSVPINNNFELKLLLNPGIKIQNDEFIIKFNNDFINKINKKNLIYKSFEKLSTMPIVWFYFENERDRQNFVAEIKDWNEIFKLIIFENKKNLQFPHQIGNLSDSDSGAGALPISSHYPGAKIDLNHYLFKSSFSHNSSIVNAEDYLDNPYVNKIGILEVWAHKFDEKFKHYFKNGIEINNLDIPETKAWKTHSTNVSLIAGGQYGIDKSSKIYLHTFTQLDSEWMRIIEKMVKDEGIRVINHSYGLSLYLTDKNGKKYISPEYLKGYSENSYFLDYISRKYGVINVFGASNDGKDENHLITGTQLSFNSVVVGALSNSASYSGLKSNKVAEYSNYRLSKEFENISKPLVVAPGKIYTTVYGEYRYAAGTSYAAPIVTGLISNLMKYKEDIRNSNNRVPIVKAILSASAVSPKLQNLTYKTSGYEQKYGSGTVDFKAMLQAANNYKVKTLNSNSSNNTILTSDEIKLTKGQTIKISSSWTFNAGLLKERVINPLLIDDRNWWNDVYNTTPKYRPKDLVAEARKWGNQHENELWLKKEEMLNRQSNKWFTDYDLFLEQKNSNGDWITVKRVSTILTNDELIEHKADVTGTYRYKILKFSSNSFDNSVDDIVAVTHVVRNENE